MTKEDVAVLVLRGEGCRPPQRTTRDVHGGAHVRRAAVRVDAEDGLRGRHTVVRYLPAAAPRNNTGFAYKALHNMGFAYKALNHTKSAKCPIYIYTWHRCEPR